MRRMTILGGALVTLGALTIGCAAPSEEAGSSEAAASLVSKNFLTTVSYLGYQSPATPTSFAVEIDQAVRGDGEPNAGFNTTFVSVLSGRGYTRSKDRPVLYDGQTSRNADVFRQQFRLAAGISGEGDALTDDDALTAILPGSHMTIETELTFGPKDDGSDAAAWASTTSAKKAMKGRYACSIDVEFPMSIRALLWDEDFLQRSPDDVAQYQKALRDGDAAAAAAFQKAHAIAADLGLRAGDAGDLAIVGVRGLSDGPADVLGLAPESNPVANARAWSDSALGGAGACTYDAPTGFAIGVGGGTFRAASCAGTLPVDGTLRDWTGEYYGIVRNGNRWILDDHARDANPQARKDALLVRRTDPAIDFAWGGGAPDPLVTSRADAFGARWTKSFHADQASTYAVRAFADDGIRVIVDGSVVLEEWREQGMRPNAFTTDFQVAPGDHTVTVEYYESGGDAVAKVAIGPKGSIPSGPELGELPLAKASNLRAFVKQTMLHKDTAAACDPNPLAPCADAPMMVIRKAGRRFVGRIESRMLDAKLSNIACTRQ